MPHPLDGTLPKIERAYENIRNLNAEISTFLDTARYTATAEHHPKGFLIRTTGPKASPRIRVLIGEVVHNLRTSLNHLAGQLVRSAGRQITEDTEFPIFWDATKYPAGKKRQIEAWPHADAEKIVDDLQPFKHIPPEDSPLLILHKMNILDKHQLLIATVSKIDLGTTTRIQIALATQNAKISSGNTKVDMDPQKAVDIVFPEFGTRQSQSVVPSLMQLANFVELEVVGKLAPFIK
jgi:hypothetical protein